MFFIESIQQKNSLLFFVEVDMGTEAISSSKNPSRAFRQKILNYQDYFHSKGYKQYEDYWKREFSGFRLLIITNNQAHLNGLCRLVIETPPSDFIWLTDEDSLHSHGISDKIWIRGGRTDSPLESILGPSMACSTPILPIKD